MDCRNTVFYKNNQETILTFMLNSRNAGARFQFTLFDKRVRDIFIEKIYETADIIRVYTRAPGKEPDLNSPFVLPRGSTLETLATKIHKDFAEKLKFARMWGSDVFDGQMVQRDYVLQDGDTAEIHL